MFDIEDYSVKYLDQYQNQSFETILVEVRRRQVLASLHRYPHRRILEVGCGLEPLFCHLDTFDSYTIVEPSKEFVEHAQQLASHRNNVTVLENVLEAAQEQLAGQNFDFIVVSSLLHEVPNPMELLNSIHHLCNQNTTVHINVPNVFSFHRLLALEMGLIEDIFERSTTEERFQRQTRFDKQTLFDIVEVTGFEVVTSGTYFIKPFTHEQMEKLLSSGILDMKIIEGLEKMVKYMPDMGCEMFVDAKRK